MNNSMFSFFSFLRVGTFLILVLVMGGCGTSLKNLERKKAQLENTKNSINRIETQISKQNERKERNRPKKPTPVKGTREDQINKYVNRHAKLAVSEMNKYGIPASIKLAQGILETKYGTSDLALKGKNHFGIKCHRGWNGPSMRVTDDAPNECFRKYRSVTESYRDHSIFLTSRARYGDLFDLSIKDYKGWAHGLKKAGYATNPKYAQGLISLIDEFELHRYDRGARTSKVPRKPKSNPSEVIHSVSIGDTLYSIAERYNVKVSDIKKANNIDGNLIKTGQRLVIRLR